MSNYIYAKYGAKACDLMSLMFNVIPNVLYVTIVNTKTPQIKDS